MWQYGCDERRIELGTAFKRLSCTPDVAFFAQIRPSVVQVDEILNILGEEQESETICCYCLPHFQPMELGAMNCWNCDYLLHEYLMNACK